MEKINQFLLYEKEVAEFKLKLINRLSGDEVNIEPPRQKRTSIVAMVGAILTAGGKPLHVTEIISVVSKEFGITLDRDSLSSALIKQVRKEKRFIRVAPNTFGLRQT